MIHWTKVFDERCVVNCKTKQDLKSLFLFLNAHGFSWCDNTNYDIKNSVILPFFNLNFPSVCIDVTEGKYDVEQYFISRNRTVVDFNDIDWTDTVKYIQNGTRVQFEIDGENKIGKIVGVANTGYPVVGVSYIIESNEIYSTFYPYYTIVLPEIFFKII